jgi:hypothetical protein
MFDWCNKSPDLTPNELCKKSPWKKCEEKKLCPFALVWKHWNLAGRIPKQYFI